MVVREIVVVKKPRDDTLQDKPISFPNLDNLHLDMMENKKKLKKNLPLLVVKPPPSGDVKDTKKATYPAAIISGTAGAAAGVVATVVATAVVEKTKKKKEKFTPTKGKDAVEEDDEGELLENLGADGDEGDALDLGDDEGGGEKETGTSHSEDAGDEGKAAGGAGDDASGDGEAAADDNADDDPYAGLSPEERERQEKEEYIWRFRILKKKYKNRKDIQDYNEHDDLVTMKQTYERTLRDIQLEDNYESYRMYLIGGFMLMEFVSNNWMGVDLTGFTAHQMTMMHKYDRMLIELGEKSYNRWGSNLPVEIRLIGFIILQAGIFYLGKIIADKGGGALTDIFKMFTGESATPIAAAGVSPSAAAPGGEDAPTPKKKMRGPSVKVADLKKKVDTDAV